MSRRKPSPAEVLVMLPWPVSAVLAVLAFVGLHWVLPGIEFEDALFGMLAKATKGWSWVALLLFGGLSVLSAVVRAKKRVLLDGQRDLESLRALSWQQFERLVGEAYRRQGYAVEESMTGGSDGGIDLILRKGGQTILVQCKRWKTQSVGAPIIREQFGLLTHHNADKTIVVTSGRFTRAAMAFAQGKPIELVDGPALLTLVQAVQRQPTQPASVEPAVIATLPQPVVSKSDSIISDSAPPALEVLCPACGGTMVERTAKRGVNAGNPFWGCSSYPTCRGVRTA